MTLPILHYFQLNLIPYLLIVDVQLLMMTLLMMMMMKKKKSLVH